MLVYHITTRLAWEAATADGVYRAPSLASQGFIHFSKEEQVQRVAEAVFRGQTGLVLLTVNSALLDAELRLEAPDTGVPATHHEAELYPHLYGALNVAAVVAVEDFTVSPT